MPAPRSHAWLALVPFALVAVGAAPPPARDELRLEDAVALALEHHPALRAAALAQEASEADARQAGRRPNPELAFSLENAAGSGPLSGLDAAETTVEISQAFELGGKRSSRVRAAVLAGDVAAAERERARRGVRAEAALAFVEVLAAQERVALADTLVTVSDAVLAAVAQRVQAGGISAVEERRARVALETDRVTRAHLARTLEAARARLAAACGDPEPRFARAVGDLARLAAVPPREDLARQLGAGPDLAVHEREARRERATADAASALGAPDLTLSGGLRRFAESDDTAFLVGVGLPLPLFDRNRDAAHAAARRAEAAEARQAETRAALTAELVAEHAELAASRDEAAALADRILPEAAAAFTESADAYRQGRLRLTDVLDAKRTLFELRGRYVDVLARHHAAAARLERIAGAPEDASPDAEGR